MAFLNKRGYGPQDKVHSVHQNDMLDNHTSADDIRYSRLLCLQTSRCRDEQTETFFCLFASVGVCFSVIGTFVALSQVLLMCVLLATSQLENTKLTRCHGNRLTSPSFESPRTSPSTSSQLGGMCLHVFACACAFKHQLCM